MMYVLPSFPLTPSYPIPFKTKEEENAWLGASQYSYDSICHCVSHFKLIPTILYQNSKSVCHLNEVESSDENIQSLNPAPVLLPHLLSVLYPKQFLLLRL